MNAAARFAEIAQARGKESQPEPPARSRAARSRRGAERRAGAGRLAGLPVLAIDPATGVGVDCRVRTVSAQDADLDCPAPPAEHAVGQYVRSIGEDVDRYQVRHASITSAKAHATPGRLAVRTTKPWSPMRPVTRLAAHGLTVLAPWW